MSFKPTNYTGPVWLPGTVLWDARLRIVKVLGRGGMAVVYEVEHLDTRQRYALKVLSAHLADRIDLVARFLQEARVLGALRNAPNIVTLHAAGLFENNQPYLLLELLKGRTLREVLSLGRLPFALSCWYVQQLLWSLAVVHQGNLVHRDVKPENFFLQDDGTCKLLDFGIVKVVLESPVARGFITGRGVVLGTSLYMAPEHLSGKVPDARADVFAAGVMLFEALLGARPLAHLSDRELKAHIMTKGFPSLEEAGGFDVPPELRAVVRRATANDPNERYPNVVAFAADLNRVVQHLGLVWQPALGERHATAPSESLPPGSSPSLQAFLPQAALPMPEAQRPTANVGGAIVVPPEALPSPPDGAAPPRAPDVHVPPAPANDAAAPSLEAAPGSAPAAAGSSHPPLHGEHSSTPPRWRSPTPPRRSLVKAFVPRFEDFVARMFGMLTSAKQARAAKPAKVYPLEERRARQVGEAAPNSERPFSSPVTPPTSAFPRRTAIAAGCASFGLVFFTLFFLRSQATPIRALRAQVQAFEPFAVSPKPARPSVVATSSATAVVPALSSTSAAPGAASGTAPPSPSDVGSAPPLAPRLGEPLPDKGAATSGHRPPRASNAPPGASTSKGSPSGSPLPSPKRLLPLPK